MINLEEIFKEGAWKSWSLAQRIQHVKGSSGGFNLKRQDINSIPDHAPGPSYKMRTIKMAVSVIDDLLKELEKYGQDIMKENNNGDSRT